LIAHVVATDFIGAGRNVKTALTLTVGLIRQAQVGALPIEQIDIEVFNSHLFPVINSYCQASPAGVDRIVVGAPGYNGDNVGKILVSQNIRTELIIHSGW